MGSRDALIPRGAALLPAPRHFAVTAAVALVASALALISTPPAVAAGTEYYVAPYGDDQGPGTIDGPWATVEKGVTSLQPGDVLFLRGGTYVERIKNPEVADGTSSSPITVRAFPGERPVVQGLFWINGADHWTYDGVNVTWDLETGGSGEYMVKLKGGTGWVFTNAEVWGAHSKGAIRVAGDATDWTLSDLFVHDTYRTNDDDEDDLVFVNTKDGGGVLERSLLVNSENGRAVRIGPKKKGGNETSDVIVRYNTMYNNVGPSNIQIFYGAAGNEIHHNLMVGTEDAAKADVMRIDLSGTGNHLWDNLGWESKEVVGKPLLVDGGGNVQIDPAFADPARGDFRPTNPEARAYGLYATEEPEPEPEGAYRAFSDSSYWNTPLPPDVPIDPKSGAYIDYMQGNIVGDFVMLSGADEDGAWGTPIYWAEPTDPVYDVTSDLYRVPPEFASVKIPRGAQADDTSDGEIVVYDLERGIVIAMWQAKYNASRDTWTCSGGDVWYLGSNGLEGIVAGSDEPRNSGHRGAPAPIFAIRWDEIEAGVIDHILKVVIPEPSATSVWPMSDSDGDAKDPDAPPEGARFRLKRSIDLDSMGLSPAEYAVAKAAQEYGFMITDGSGAPVSAGLENVVAEGRGWLWEGDLAWDSLSLFSLSDYEFVEMGYGSP
jgi:hypothetical protein